LKIEKDSKFALSNRFLPNLNSTEVVKVK